MKCIINQCFGRDQLGLDSGLLHVSLILKLRLEKSVIGGLFFSWWVAGRQEVQMEIYETFQSLCLKWNHFLSAHSTLVKASHVGITKGNGDRDV